jgi:uncharacterized DUF497 family protein
VALTFEWDPAKALENERKHGVTFEEATTSFGDLRSLTIADPDHSEAEDRYVLLGMSFRGRLLTIVHTERGANIRIISARPAARKEAEAYSEAQ